MTAATPRTSATRVGARPDAPTLDRLGTTTWIDVAVI